MASFYYGRPTLTLQNQVWQAAGFTSDQANLAEALTGLGLAAGNTVALNRALQTWQPLSTEGAPSPKNVLPDNPSQLDHILRDASGHLKNTPENRKLLLDVANESGNLKGFDAFGNEIFLSVRPGGAQIWVQARNGVIQNGGVNTVPWVYVPGVGLRRP